MWAPCILGALVSLISFSEAFVYPASALSIHDGNANGLEQLNERVNSRSTCTNGLNSRQCWDDGFSIATDADASFPTTGVTRFYDLIITNTTCNPDGAGSRHCMLINNQYPGPTINANWGDFVSVTVTNLMPENGTSIHFHGVRQLNNNRNDGTNGVTECPIAPGYTKTYTWQATQYGTSWYHSHFSVQYGDGVAGPIVIQGPASANYDYDLGPMPVSDWYTNRSAWQENIQAAIELGVPGPPAAAQNTLMNGKANMPNSTTEGAGFSRTTVTRGKRYRLRIISMAVDNTWYVSLDGHQIEIIAADFVPVKPLPVDFFMLAPGQRYDIVFTADNIVGDYWLRATVAGDCQTANAGLGLAIISYKGAPAHGIPTESIDPPYTGNGCVEPSPLVPYAPNTVGNEASFRDEVANLPIQMTPGKMTNGQSIGVWIINSTQAQTSWERPTMSYIMAKDTEFPAQEDVISMPQLGGWTYWILQEVEDSLVNIAHPMHLHGHSFYVMGSGVGTFDKNTMMDELSFVNATKRDTVQLRPKGWLVLGWKLDNPGAWLFHCHIAWHVAWGLSLQFVEAESQIQLPGPEYKSQCDAWDAYNAQAVYKQDDSGV